MPLADDVDLEKIAQRTDRFTGADLEDLVRRAGLTALRRGLDAAKVTMADFEVALGETRASVTPEMLEEYARIQETLKSDATRPLGGIGFVLPGMLQPARRRKTVASSPRRSSLTASATALVETLPSGGAFANAPALPAPTEYPCRLHPRAR